MTLYMEPNVFRVVWASGLSLKTFLGTYPLAKITTRTIGTKPTGHDNHLNPRRAFYIGDAIGITVQRLRVFLHWICTRLKAFVRNFIDFACTPLIKALTSEPLFNPIET